MSDQEGTAVEPRATQSTIAAEIERSIGSILQRREGTRPANVSTEIDGDAIRCVIESGEPAEEPAGEPEPGAGSGNAYRTEATAAISRITRRTVAAYIAGGDAASGRRTQTFILERNRVKF